VKKVTGGGHHGGAWKVAYADFVTAMMAFFLLMWLLNATTEDQRKGLADYFNPSIPISPMSGGGTELLEGATIFSVRAEANAKTERKKETQSTSEANGSGDRKSDNKSTSEALKEEETLVQNAQQAALEAVEEDLLSQIGGDQTQGLVNHIQLRVTPEGLVIELVDTNDTPLFNVGSTNASPIMVLLLDVVAQSLSLVENKISIVGHTDSLPYSSRRNYSNWELSTDRAHAARRLMIASGLPITQVNEVAGKADSEPLVEDRFAPQNRRISITILKS
jgi:chemotaxis protein MotB